ncbi:MAG: aspartate-semialdehyde dehydrogenase [Methanothrix sp.]|jgi:aspartate-semialdehyde dehydrogenase|uniref:aspartate-semialdehyde dehydrogenase n=1 Tax=Methanothrix harundinacea TaxID=301375 RepID=A0A101FSA8_9EURY|nr:MAG: Aspartate-semialdehyde dehydrogenase [Methanothrix harundinacea]MDD3709619.1 aspartate-semialdehyde dehydrogenase [Methanothrix sp.]MDI9399052.1 aspartate-semialdehyde dehydrogenase [Euryarchaeota archaeon]KUK95066.1 MAG: Aspartate-semialdehyde dehydrogenase [Methanothrix harundinacea]MCP1392146.1 aspartate-semialdehyde dehydrogenase [Methanothrix harundinacea]
MAKIRAGVLGATGAVGQRFIQQLWNHPWFELTSLAASERSAGKKYCEAARWRLEHELPPEVGEMGVVGVDPKEVEADVVFSALPADEAKKVEAEFAKEGFVVASNASSYRFEPDVPLMIPECNPEHLGLVEVQQKKRGWDGYIVTNPNCTTIMFALTLKPLMPLDIQRVIVASMQAVSGAGYEGVPSMAILGNVIPFISGEEEKVEKEAQKILGTFDGDRIVDAPFGVSASCHRVPVMDGHTEALWVEMASKPTPEEVREVFLKFDPGLDDLPTEPKRPLIVRDEPDRPQPRLDRNAGKGMAVSVGRIREGIRYIVMGHNTVRGAAGASVLNAELLSKKGML